MRQLQTEIRAVLEAMGDVHRSDKATPTFSTITSGLMDRDEVVKRMGPESRQRPLGGAVGPMHIAASLAIALGLVITTWGLIRGSEAPRAATAAALSAPAPPTPASASPPSRPRLPPRPSRPPPRKPRQ
jgi:hypothetical protein